VINSVVSNNVAALSVPAAGKSESAAPESQGKTFQDILCETVDRNGLKPWAGTDEVLPDGMTKYVELEMNGRWVRQVTDEYLAHKGYNVEVMQANHIAAEEVWKYADGNGFVPKYVLPLDLLNMTDYARTLATPENLAQTAANNASFGLVSTYNPTIQDIIKKFGGSGYLQPNHAELQRTETVRSESVRPETVKGVAEDVRAEPERTVRNYVQESGESVANISKMFTNYAASLAWADMAVLDILKPEEDDDEKR
jgi:hypothetical protein